MVTITINLENGNEASDACREVARMIEDGYTSGIIGCSGDTFEIEGDDEEEEEAATSRFGPLLTVAMTFIVGEMGDKTQFAAMTMAAQYDSWPMVLLGAVVGMVLADSLGILAGAFLHRKLPARTMRYLSAGIFLFFGVLGLLQSAFQGVFA